MAKESVLQLRVSDWVKGKSKDGELIHGYIEAVDSLQGIVKVTIVQSDNEESVGKSIELRSSWVEKLTTAETQTEQQLHSLIDLALATRDKAWFLELSEKMQQVQQGSTAIGTRTEVSPAVRNRFGKFGIHY